MLKVSVHIDGFNLYHAIDSITKEDNTKNYLKWVNYKTIMDEFIDPSKEKITNVYFYSASPKHKSQEIIDRHTSFVNALTNYGITYIEGHFKMKGKNPIRYEEKETDVNIAINIVKDAYEKISEKIILVTNDSDISPAVRLARSVRPALKIKILTPPLSTDRKPNFDLQQSAGQFIKLGRTIIRKSVIIKEIHLERHLLPEVIITSNGVIKIPDKYKRN